MLKLFKCLLIIFALLMMALTGLLFAVVESQPLVVANSSQQVAEADSVKELMRQISYSLKHRSKSQTIELSADQLNSLVGFAQRANRNFSGSISISPSGMQSFASYQLPSNPLGQFLNLDLRLLPSEGVAVEHLKVGGLSIPGPWALAIATTLVNWYTSSDLATRFIEQVESIDMKNGVMRVNIQPLQAFLNEWNSVKQGMNGSSDEELRMRTTYYLKLLSDLEAGKQSRSQSLATFIGPVFSAAQTRSTYATAAEENEAAIMALAIFAGHYRFANFVGEVQPVVGKIAKPKTPVILAKRVDLNQHFIFSAAIKILSEQGLSIAIGEFKELMDRGKGGSGYSYVDLAADYAGVKFAQTATDPEKALSLQGMLAGISTEEVFFPSIQGLPEGFSKAEFERRFGAVDSPEYLKLINDIHFRVNSLAIHQ